MKPSQGVPATLPEAERPRDYWFAESIAVVHRARRLSYNALLRQYQLEDGGLRETFDTLGEALSALGDLTGWPVLGEGLVEGGRRVDDQLGPGGVGGHQHSVAGGGAAAPAPERWLRGRRG